MITEVAPGLQRIALPLGEGPLGAVNVYLVEGDDGPVLIDTGWQTPEALAALEAALATLGRRPADLRLIVLTHAHPDHCGLVVKLRALSGAPVLLHPDDAPLVDPRRLHGDAWASETGAWLARHGLPAAESVAAESVTGRFAALMPPFQPDGSLRDGEHLSLGRFTFQVRWTPGHSPGHVCLYEPGAGLLIAGDHVLPTISPNIGLVTPAWGNPLGDYLASLARTRDLPVAVVLPGHGEPFAGLAARVDALIAHHEARLAEMLDALRAGPLTAFGLCARLSWAGGRVRWGDLPPFQHVLDLTETIAHLELLCSRGAATRWEAGGTICYAAG